MCTSADGYSTGSLRVLERARRRRRILEKLSNPRLPDWKQPRLSRKLGPGPNPFQPFPGSSAHVR